MLHHVPNVFCPGGGIGRHTGFKILRLVITVRVQVSSWAPNYLSIIAS